MCTLGVVPRAALAHDDLGGTTTMKKTAALATAVVTALLLAGCASGGSGADATPTPKAQSKAAACKSLEGDMKSVSSELQEQTTNLQSNPKKAVSELQKFDAKLKAATDDVSKLQASIKDTQSSTKSLSKICG